MTDQLAQEPAVSILDRLIAELGQEVRIAEEVHLDSRKPGTCWGARYFETLEAEFRHRTLTLAAEVRRTWGPFDHEGFIDAAVSLYRFGGPITAAWRRRKAVAYVTLRHPPIEGDVQDPRAHFLVVLGAVAEDDAGADEEGPNGEPAVAALRLPPRRPKRRAQALAERLSTALNTAGVEQCVGLDEPRMVQASPLAAERWVDAR